MKFWDEARVRNGAGRPCWAEASQLALPELAIDPEEEGQKFCASLMLARPDFSARWVHRSGLGLVDLARLAIAWHDGPEEAISAWFGEEAPNSATFVAKAKARPRQVVSVGDINVEDLGL